MMEGLYPLLTFVVVVFVLLVVLNARKSRRRDATWANYNEAREMQGHLDRIRGSGGGW